MRGATTRCALALAAVLWTAASGVVAADPTPAEAMRLAFPTSGAFERFTPEPTVEQMRTVVERARSGARGKLGEVWVATTDGRLDGVAFIDHVIGRTEYISYLCAIDADGRVRRVEVLAYREPYGGEVRDRRFLAQFEGRGADDPLRRDRPIANIAGATMSVDALSERVRFLLDFHHVVVGPAAAQWLAARAPAPAPAAATAPAAPAAPAALERSRAIGNAPLAIRVESGDPASATTAVEAALDRAEALDAVLNQWRADSELARLNASGGGAASPALRAALAEVADAHALTGGLFDPTVGPLITLWKQADERDALPGEPELVAARAAVGWARVAVADGALRLPDGMRLDLGGIAKGQLLDAAAAELAPRLATGQSALLSFGGSSWRAIGGAPAAPIALRDPRDPARTVGSVRLPAGAGLGAAGSDGRVFTIGGQRFSHLIDPRTGAPGPLGRAAWVVAPDATLADGLDTACCLATPEEALALAARRPGVELLLWDGSRWHATPGWPGDRPAE